MSNHEPTVTGHETPDDDEISLLDLAIVLAKHKKFILGFPFAVAVLAAIVSLLMTPIYTATTKILPPQQTQSSAAAMLGQLGALAGTAGVAIGIKNPSDLYVGMLKSRTVADNLIERFKLMTVYEAKLMSGARNTLGGVSKITAGKDGMVTVEVDDKDPKLAAALANAYVEELLKLTTVLAVTEAGQRRLFFERQLREAKDNLTNAEIAARTALDKGGIAVVDEQSKSMIETTAVLRAQIAAKEVQINAMQGFATERNSELVRARQELSALRQQLEKIEGGGGHSGAVAGAKSNGHGLRNVALLRDVKYYEVLFELIAKQFEMAKLDEAKEGAVIQVIDKAIEPDRKSRPKRALIVILSTLVAGFVAVLLAFMKEALDKARQDPSSRERIGRLLRYLAWRRPPLSRD